MKGGFGANCWAGGVRGKGCGGWLQMWEILGTFATVKFVCESALCLAVDFDRLPGGAARGGILTPATGLGDVLVERLRQAGMELKVEMMR